VNDLISRLESEQETYTVAEQRIALFLINNRDTLPFETAASIAKHLEISSITVGRFCRMLGYKNFRALKEELRSTASLPWLSGSEFQDFLASFNDNDKRRKTLEREIELLVAVYEKSQSAMWADAVALIARSKTVQIIGFQTEQGIAALLAHALQYIRPGVRLLDQRSGSFADILLEEADGQCLVIVDVRRYSRQSQRLAEKACERGIPLVVITDTYCDWAPRLTKYVLTADNDGSLFWHSSVAMVGLVNLLVNDVVGHGGGIDVEPRLDLISGLYDDFVGFSKSTKGRKRGR
jgi:DNA-binding MurR/RpiR family transcriptional regulator